VSKAKRALTDEERAERKRKRAERRAERAAELDRLTGGQRGIGVAEAARIVGVRRETLWRWVDAGHFPMPRQLGPTAASARGFLLAEVLAWIASRPAVPGATK
jgi:predicted DNA-binding transcriptional regulator AlpA